MRIVDYHKDTTALPFQLIKGMAWVAGIFSLLVCALIIANNLSLKITDPIHSPALQRLVEELKTNPKDEALRQEIRELDHLARRAFFTSQQFNRVGIYMLVGGLVVMVIALKSLETFKTVPPYPDSADPKDDIVENAKWARKAVTAVGLVLVGFALIIALPWQSTLDLPKEPLAVAAAPIPEPKTIAITEKPIAIAEDRLANWPGFLGPQGGVSCATGLLTSWDGESGEGIKWKSAVPLTGFSSPIIWKGTIYLSGADETTREVYCFDVETGKLLWQKAAQDIPGSPEDPPEVTEDTGYAAATMATDGERVFAIFSTGDLMALDFEGNQVWAKNLGVPANPYGHSSSLLIHEDILLVQYDQKKDGFLAGFDVATGQVRWSTPRDLGASWSSPTLIHTDEHVEVVLAAEAAAVSYSPKNGKELWRCECLEGAEVAPTPVFADGLLYVSADYSKLSAIDVKSHEVVWENEDLMPGVSTPLVAEGRLYAGLSDGGIVCFDAKTGEVLWNEDTDYGFYASPILADGRVYLMDRQGNMHIFKSGAEYEMLGMPALGEIVTSTAAALGDSLYLRGMKNLYRIGP